MKLTTQYSICIAEPGTKGPVSRARKQFNTLIKKIEAMRLRLAAWNEAMPSIMRQAEQEFQPLVQAYSVHQKALVLLLDQMHQHKSMGKKERAKLVDLICSVALDVLADGDDAELKDIYNRHSGGDFDAEADQDGAAFRDMMEQILGVQMDAEVDLRSPEAMLEALAAQMHQRAEQEQQTAQAKAATRPKPASALAREQRQAAEADKLKQSVRDIFRKLVSELHPDREPDAAERERKTALMQRVNVAYAANDLLDLLALQLEIEQIEQADLNNLSEERIKQYNKILDGQLRELERETAGSESAAAQEMSGQQRGRLTPQALLRCLHVDIAEMQAKLDAIVAELEEFRDVNKLKAWLKTYQPVEASDYSDAYWY
ncbi:molecular chaperone DnaJ [Janthinobacterium sp. HLX7-2]|uniref:molecular chaperone DnaJ n=1 Tax=Janthinobacterium sp. HLX7-2 TaxID=1259331 RepID=UPI003F22F8FD